MLVPLAGILLLFALWSGYWVFADAAAKSHAANYRERLAAEGVNLACGSESWGGYPFRFEFSCRQPALRLPHERLLRGQSLLIAAQAYNPMHVIALIDSPTSVRSANGGIDNFTHDRAVASVTFRGGGLVQIAAEVSNLDGAGLITAKDIQFHSRPGKDNGNDIAVTVDTAQYTSPGKPPLDIDNAQLLTTLTAGQELEIASIEMQRGPLKLWGKGSLSLDPAHRLSGRIAAQTNDLDGLLTLLDPHLDLTDQERAAIKTLLGLLGRQAKVDLIAQDGELFIGPIKIGDLQPLY
jgi:hypothetical protein